MKPNQRPFALFLACSGAILLAACGGSGNGDGTSSAPTAPASQQEASTASTPAKQRADTGNLASFMGDNICDVVTARLQFAISTTNKNYMLRNPVAWQTAWTVADHALQMWDLPVEKRKFVVPDADHFVAEEHASPAWMKGQPLAVIGAHSFYRVN